MQTIKNAIQLITSVITLGMLLAVLLSGLWVYQKVAEFTSKPITLPTVNMPDFKAPKIVVEAPEIKMPKVDFGGLIGRNEDDEADADFENCKHIPQCQYRLTHEYKQQEGKR